jgi:hypothetical protein
MLGNKILPDESRAGEENKAHVHKAGRYQMMTPMPADGGTHRPPSPGEMGAGILGAPMTLDPHKNLRHTAENLGTKPGEKSRSSYTSEIHRRLHGRDVKYR